MLDLSPYEKLPVSFYRHEDVTYLAQQLLGKYLFTNIDGIITAGKIVETEAYCGRNDKACHAFGKRTKRTEVMYQAGGIAYVYLCYGIHHLFNVVTNEEGLADAVLIRALEPVIGLDVIRLRRGGKVKHNKLTAGPGTLSQALDIDRVMDGVSLDGNLIWIAKGPDESFEMEIATRIGVDYAGEDALLPWRYYIKGNPFVSVLKKKSPS